MRRYLFGVPAIPFRTFSVQLNKETNEFPKPCRRISWSNVERFHPPVQANENKEDKEPLEKIEKKQVT